MNDRYVTSEQINHSTAEYANVFTTGIFGRSLHMVENGAKKSSAELATIGMDFLQNRV